jgi:hypothetical protein
MRTVAIFSCGSTVLKSAGGSPFPRRQKKKPPREQHGLMANRHFPWVAPISSVSPQNLSTFDLSYHHRLEK